MKLHWSAVLLALTVSGCSSVSHDLAYRGGDKSSFALIAIDGIPPSFNMSYSFMFQRVDLAATQFADEMIYLSINSSGSFTSDEFTKPATMNTTVRFAGKTAPAGDYALIGRVTTREGMAGQTLVNCYTLGAAVFHLNEGAINVLSIGDVRGSVRRDPVRSKIEVDILLKDYPKMVAPTSVAPMIGSITFRPGRALLGGRDTCNPSGAVTFTPAHTKPSAAEQI